MQLDEPQSPQQVLQVEESEQLDERTRRDTMTINMGPQHPSTHGVLRLILTLDGETIIKAVPDIGYLHTGIEKTGEGKSYFQTLVLTDRMDYLAPLCNNLAYSLAVEKLLGIEVPPRAQYARVVLAELQRIASHLVWLGSSAIDLGAQSVFLYCFREREIILDIFELCSGVRMMTSYIMPGGLQADLPASFDKRVRDFLALFPSKLREYHTLLTNNRLWVGRTKGMAKSRPRTPSPMAAPARCCAAVALPTTCARRSHTAGTSASTSISPSAATVMSTTAISCACLRWIRACASFVRRSTAFRRAAGRWTTTRSCRRTSTRSPRTWRR
jgi:Ni,Fe-hydrogenase III large subunit